ncbi:hypothetical protein GGI07_002423 [Coemansia sp. Benny D115]|nr:hypothetical protein GGI07_002423 [Coemansia sp. Benny D115]
MQGNSLADFIDNTTQAEGAQQDPQVAHREQQHPMGSNPVGHEIAQLLQTVKEANALVHPTTNTTGENLEPTATTTTTRATETVDQANEADDDSSGLDDDSSDYSDFDDSDDAGASGNSLGKILRMIADGTDDEDDDPMTGTSKANDEQRFVTKNEVFNPVIPAPPVTEIPQGTELHTLGTIHSVVDSSVLIEALESGGRQVLDTDSLVCLENRAVVGQVFDVFGPVTRPMYTVRFNTQEEAQRYAGMAGTGCVVYYGAGWSKLVNTDELRCIKGTDASNLFDEEVASDAMEFSDDEQERMNALKKKKKRRDEAKAKSRGAKTENNTATSTMAPTTIGTAVPSAVANRQSADGRKLQSYSDLYDSDLGF